MKKYILISLFLLGACQLGSCQKENKNTSEIDSSEDVSSITLTRDRIDSLLVSTSIFDISYNEIYEQPNWVKYTVRDIVKSADRDGMNFYTVDSIYTSDDNDYYSNRWDRGHMAPAGSFNDSYANLFSTFTYLNVALQYDDLNRGAWVGLESQIREWADELGDINVEIYDFLGRLTQSNTISRNSQNPKTSLSLAEYNSGSYIVKCYNENFEAHFKVIKI